MWCKNWISRRDRLGYSVTLLQELEEEDEKVFKKHLGVDVETFYVLLSRLRHRLMKNDTPMRRAIPPKTRLQILLRHLRSSLSYGDLAGEFRVGESTVCTIIHEASLAMVEELCDELICCPTDQAEWMGIADNWYSDCSFPHCLGAIDGTHIRIDAPNMTGSRFRNYKGYFSIVMLCLVDANYRILWCSVGSEGVASDAQIFNHSPLKHRLEAGTMNFPNPRPINDDIEDFDLLYYFLGDNAFALSEYMMKPFSKLRASLSERVFNYRLSRARNRVSLPKIRRNNQYIKNY